MAPSSTFKASSISQSFSGCHLSVSLCPSSSCTYKDPRDDPGPTQITQNNLLSQGEQIQLHLQSSLPLLCNLTCSQIPGIRSWTSHPLSLTLVPPNHFVTFQGHHRSSQWDQIQKSPESCQVQVKWPWAGPRCGLVPSDPDADRPSQPSHASARASVVLSPSLLLQPG